MEQVIQEEIKVVIVDDEYLERNLLKKCFDWGSLQMEVVGEAENTEEALHVIDRENPDVLFTDIQMPGTDGIGLSELVLQRYPPMKVVVLTGYDKFDYAQRSVKAGVSDYLLKPIDGEEVQKTALKLKKLIANDRKSRREEQNLKQQLYENLPYLRERFFNELLSGVKEGIREKMSFLGIHFEDTAFQIAVFEVASEAEMSDEESRFLLGMRLCRKIGDFFRAAPNTFVFIHTTDRIVVLNNDVKTDLYEQCEVLLGQIAEQIACPLCVGLGSIHQRPDEICLSYREALEAVHYRVSLGNNTVILYDTIRLPARVEPCADRNLKEQLDFYIKTGLTGKVGDTIRKICDGIDLNVDSAQKTLRMTAMDIALSIFRSMAEAGVEPDEIYRCETQVNRRIFQLGNLPETEDFLEETARKCMDLIGGRKSNRIGSLIEDVETYVRDHFADSGLSLTDLAEKLYFNPSYLSRTFKKRAGVSFSEFLMGVRMERAAELLREGEMKAFEIAEAVGIPDPNYFSTCFKKFTGVSTSQYRKAIDENP